MPYDASTGLVFAETTVRVPSSAHRRHIKNVAQGRRNEKLRPKSHPHGARRLTEIALLTTTRHLDGLTPEVLQSLEGVLVEKIWKVVKELNLDSLSVCKLFTASTHILSTVKGAALKTLTFNTGGDGNFERLPTIVALFRCPQIPQDLSPSLSSRSPAWLTRLFLLPTSTASFTIADLMTIPRLSNLQTLYFGTQVERWEFSFDRILHAWEREVRENGAFGRLELLFLAEDLNSNLYRDTAISVDLGRLEHWPSLAEFVVATSRREAWKMPTGTMSGSGVGDGKDGKNWRRQGDTRFWKFVYNQNLAMADRTCFEECARQYLQHDPDWIARNATVGKAFFVAKVGSTEVAHRPYDRRYLLSHLLCGERPIADDGMKPAHVASSLLPLPAATTQTTTSDSPPRKKPKIRASRLQSVNAEYSFS